MSQAIEISAEQQQTIALTRQQAAGQAADQASAASAFTRFRAEKSENTMIAAQKVVK